MKPFKFDQIAKRLNRKSQKQVNEQKMRQNFLKLYDDIPPDPKMQKFCEQVKQEFDQRRKNSRYYSYELSNEDQGKLTNLRTQNIKKLALYSMPFKPQIVKRKQQDPKIVQQRSKKLIIKKNHLKKKFKQNIKLIVEKMKRMKITMQQIFSKNVFSKQPYKFGQQIFEATKQNNPQKVWKILMLNKLSIFSVDNTLKNALFWACIRGNEKIAKILVDSGIDINKVDIYGLNALNYAIKYNHTGIVKLLSLSLSLINETHLSDSKTAKQQIRNIFNLALNLKRNLKRLDTMEKRAELFDQQYQYLYK